MTKISYIAGIPSNEYADRGKEVKDNSFVPYLSLTKGEMLLALAAQRANILAEWYGSDAPQYRRAAQMFEDALNMGVSNGIKFIGSIPDELQPVAAVISRAARQTQPASKALFFRPDGIGKGIGQTVLPYQERYDACRDKVDQQFPLLPNTPANKAYNDVITPKRISAFAACKRAFDIERILNGGIENSSHHVVYKDMPSGVVLPTEVIVKRTFHRTGVEGMALVGDIDAQLMYGWVENGIIGKNAQVGAGPLSSVKTSAYLAPDPQAAFEAIQKKRPGADKWSTVNGVGVVDPVTGAIVIKIVGAITGALTAAAALLAALRSQKAYAMSEARGFGTDAFSASQNDWLLSQNNPPGTSPGSVNPLLVGAGLVGAYLLLK